jgi:hypothetical protein
MPLPGPGLPDWTEEIPGLTWKRAGFASCLSHGMRIAHGLEEKGEYAKDVYWMLSKNCLEQRRSKISLRLLFEFDGIQHANSLFKRDCRLSSGMKCFCWLE